MYRFVLSRRWVGFALFVIVLATLCVRLGFWQLDRHHQKAEQNEIVRANMDSEPVSAQDVQERSSNERSGQEWQPVRVSGTYDTQHQVVLKYQTRKSLPGVEVVTPLVTSSGRAVLVDRGWMESDNNTDQVTDIPAPPSGTVTVTGWWRPDSAAEDHAVEPDNGQVRAISSEGISTAVDYDLFNGYLDLREQHPGGESELEPEPRPDLGQGPHFFYSMQWYFFAALAVFGWFYFAWSEAHPERTRRNARSQNRPQTRPEPGTRARSGTKTR